MPVSSVSKTPVLSTYAAASHASGIDLMMSESPGSVMDMHDTR